MAAVLHRDRTVCHTLRCTGLTVGVAPVDIRSANEHAIHYLITQEPSLNEC